MVRVRVYDLCAVRTLIIVSVEKLHIPDHELDVDGHSRTVCLCSNGNNLFVDCFQNGGEMHFTEFSRLSLSYLTNLFHFHLLI